MLRVSKCSLYNRSIAYVEYASLPQSLGIAMRASKGPGWCEKHCVYTTRYANLHKYGSADQGKPYDVAETVQNIWWYSFDADCGQIWPQGN